MSEKETLRLSDELLDVLEGLAEMRLDKMTWDELERMQVALPALLADARKVETLTEERDSWRATAEVLGDTGMMADLLSCAEEERDALASQVETLRETLRFYAERRNYLPAAGGDSYDAMVARDSYDDGGPGARARAALEGERDE